MERVTDTSYDNSKDYHLGCMIITATSFEDALSQIVKMPDFRFWYFTDEEVMQDLIRQNPDKVK